MFTYSRLVCNIPTCFNSYVQNSNADIILYFRLTQSVLVRFVKTGPQATSCDKYLKQNDQTVKEMLNNYETEIYKHQSKTIKQ